MKYLVAHFNLTCSDDLLSICRDLVAAAAGEAGFESFEETPQGLDGYVQDTLLDRDVLDASLADLGLPDVAVAYTLEETENKDWNEEWESAGFDPIEIDRRLLVVDAGRGEDVDAEGMTPIYIRARQAFGTGTHQTTRLMLSALLKQLKPGKRVLDCGCGTGILGIAASLLGAADVTGYDIDEWSVDNTRHNAQLNGAELTVMHGDATVLQSVEGRFDIVMANINRNILLADLPAFDHVLADDGTLLLSGFYEEDAAMILDAAAKLGLQEAERSVEDGWTCLALRRVKERKE